MDGNSKVTRRAFQYVYSTEARRVIRKQGKSSARGGRKYVEILLLVSLLLKDLAGRIGPVVIQNPSILDVFRSSPAMLLGCPPLLLGFPAVLLGLSALLLGSLLCSRPLLPPFWLSDKQASRNEVLQPGSLPQIPKASPWLLLHFFPARRLFR